MKIKGYDLRTIPMLLFIWGLIVWRIFANNFYDGDVSRIGATIIWGFLWLLVVIFYNGPFYRYVIDEEGIRISCFRGEIGFLSWENVATIGISRWGNMTDSLYISIFSPSKLIALFKTYKEDPLHIRDKASANPLLWKSGIAALNEQHPILLLKSDKPSNCRQGLKQLLELNSKYATKYHKIPVSVYSLLKLT